MSVKSVTVTQGTPVQILDGSYTVTRISTSGTAGASLNLYDSKGNKTWSQPALTLKNTVDMAAVRLNPPNPPGGSQTDCGGVARIYEYGGPGRGVGYGADTVITANASATLPVIATVAATLNPTNINLVTTKGLYGELIGAAGNTITVTVEYSPNISS